MRVCQCGSHLIHYKQEGTIRKLFASSIERNAVHGSDAVETAALEIAFFFSERELN